jgi:outer membrane protein assembly factor BamE (lipoprotein component of BamABCDE complex)
MPYPLQLRPFADSTTMKTFPLAILLAFLVAVLGACAQYENKRGVDVNWQTEVTGKLVKGESSRRDVLELLGPPSQVISLEDESVLYYLFEHSKGEGLILILYNRMRIDTRYDRAIFFFDDNDLLTEYSFSAGLPPANVSTVSRLHHTMAIRSRRAHGRSGDSPAFPGRQPGGYAGHARAAPSHERVGDRLPVGVGALGGGGDQCRL